MAERRTITVVLQSWESFAVPASAFVEELAALIVTVPEEHRAKVEIEFDRHGGDYDTTQGELTVRYVRPETDDEIRAREESSEAHRIKEEDRERKIFERLKRKFEP